MFYVDALFGRISVEWRNLTMKILAYGAALESNFVEIASLILVSIEIMFGIILIYLSTLNMSAKKGRFHQKLCPPLLGIIFYVEESIFAKSVAVYKASEF